VLPIRSGLLILLTSALLGAASKPIYHGFLIRQPKKQTTRPISGAGSNPRACHTVAVAPGGALSKRIITEVA